MNGVMIPETSAGSNHIGASDTCTPQISCPSVPAAIAEPGAPATRPSAASARISRRVTPLASSPDSDFARALKDGSIGLLRLARPFMAGPCADCILTAAYMSSLLCRGASAEACYPEASVGANTHAVVIIHQ